MSLYAKCKKNVEKVSSWQRKPPLAYESTHAYVQRKKYFKWPAGNKRKTMRTKSVAIGSKYDVISYNVAVKPVVWSAFAMSLESVLT